MEDNMEDTMEDNMGGNPDHVANRQLVIHNAIRPSSLKTMRSRRLSNVALIRSAVFCVALSRAALSRAALSRAALSRAVVAVLAMGVGAAHARFTESVIEVGFLVQHPLLYASFNESKNRFILVAGHDDSYAQQIAIYRLGDGANPAVLPAISFSPHPELVAYDIGRLGSDDTVVFLAPGRIMRLDLDSGNLIELIRIDSLFGQERSGEIVPLDFFRDLNDDGLDDLVVPDLAGYRVRLQLPDGGFGEEALLRESVAMKLREGRASFKPRTLYSGDANFDGLHDIVTWRGDTLLIYPQQAGNRFAAEPQRTPLNLGILSEAQTLALDSDRGAIDQSQLTTRHIWSVSDFNSDGIPDILTEATLSKGVFDKRNEFRLHLGRRDATGLGFNATEDALLDSKGQQFGLVEIDIDGDGRKDLVVHKVNMNFAKVIAALLSGSASMQIQFYKMTDDGRFPERANYEAKTKVRFSVSSGQIDIPAVLVADFDGDGLQDLVIGNKKGQLELYRGEATARLFKKHALETEVLLPRNGELVQSGDINGDGAADLIIRYSVADGDKLARTVRLLFSTPPS